MPKFVVEFNKNMNNVTGNQIANVEAFLKGSVVTNYDGDSDTWRITTRKQLDPRLMNTALASAGILTANTVRVTRLN